MNHFYRLSDESDEPDEDADLTQNDFNDAAGIQRVDELYEQFLARIRRGVWFSMWFSIWLRALLVVVVDVELKLLYTFNNR